MEHEMDDYYDFKIRNSGETKEKRGCDELIGDTDFGSKEYDGV